MLAIVLTRRLGRAVVVDPPEPGNGLPILVWDTGRKSVGQVDLRWQIVTPTRTR